MRWFRSRIRLGSRLALFAFAIQIAVSFGHVHVDGLASHSSTLALAGLAPESAAALTGTRDQIQGGLADFACPICALIQLVSTSAPSAAPALPLPAIFGPFRLEAPAELALTGSPHFSFRARAPPVV